MAVFGLARRREDDALRAVRAGARDAGVRRPHQPRPAKRARGPSRAAHRGQHRAGHRRRSAPRPAAGHRRRGQRRRATRADRRPWRRSSSAGSPGGSSATRPRSCELEPLTLKGKAEPVPAFRVDGVSSGPVAHARLELPIVGRDAELAASSRASRQRVRDVGRVRVTHPSATPASARAASSTSSSTGCPATSPRAARRLPLLRRGHHLLARRRAHPGGRGDDPGDAAEVARPAGRASWSPSQAPPSASWSLAGLTDRQYPIAELFWAVRVMFEHLARERPLVVIVDGLHWAEPTLLELLDDVSEQPARRPGLPHHDGTALRGRSGAADESATRPPTMPGSSSWSRSTTRRRTRSSPPRSGMRRCRPQLVERVKRAAAGNPLFVEQFLTMLIDDGMLVARDGRVDRDGGPRAGQRPADDRGGAGGPRRRARGGRARHPRAGVRDRSRVLQPGGPGPARGPARHRTLRWPRSSVGSSSSRRATPTSSSTTASATCCCATSCTTACSSAPARGCTSGSPSGSRPSPRAPAAPPRSRRSSGTTSSRRTSCAPGSARVDDDAILLGRRAADRLAPAGLRAFTRGDMPAAANLLQRAAGDAARRRADAAPPAGPRGRGARWRPVPSGRPSSCTTRPRRSPSGPATRSRPGSPNSADCGCATSPATA